MPATNDIITVTLKDTGTAYQIGTNTIISFRLDPVSPNTGTYFQIDNNKDFVEYITATQTPAQVLLLCQNMFPLTDLDTGGTFYVNADKVVDYVVITGGTRVEYNGSGNTNFKFDVSESVATISALIAALVVEFTVTQTTGITAFAGGGQASAVLLASEYNDVTVVATGGDSVKFPVITRNGQKFIVRNDGANACDVFPGSGNQVNAGGANVAFSLATTTTRTFISDTGATPDNWVVY